MVIITIGRRRFYFRSLHIFIIGSCLTTKNLFLNQCLCPLHPPPFHINSMSVTPAAWLAFAYQHVLVTLRRFMKGERASPSTTHGLIQVTTGMLKEKKVRSTPPTALEVTKTTVIITTTKSTASATTDKLCIFSLEENFALAYEPIPLSIRLDTWRKMTKEKHEFNYTFIKGITPKKKSVFFS